MINLQAYAILFLEKIVPAIVILIVAKFVIAALLKVAQKVLDKTPMDAMLHKFFLNAIKIALWILVLFSVLSYIGINMTSFITMFAAAGAAVALALQGSLSNLAGGILIMVTRPFHKGDYIACAGNEGVVDSIDLLHTTIITVDNRVISIPNGQITSSAITNNSKMPTRRVDVNIGVSYGSNLDTAKNAIMAVAANSDLFLKDIPLTCNVCEYADSAIILNFRGWCKNANYWDAFFLMQNGIKPALDKAGVEIPFPQMDVHMDANK